MEPPDRNQRTFTTSPLGRLPDTALAIRTLAEHLDAGSSNNWTQQSTASLSHLTETLVSDLLPSLAATESVLSPHLDTDLRNLLRDAHQKIRELAERMSIVSEAMSRSRARFRPRPVHDALVALRTSLDKVESIDRIAVCRLESSLSKSELAELAESLKTATAEAREHIVLVTQPEPAPTDAYVLRKRPDLNRAYAKSLADLRLASRRTDQ